MTQGPSRDTNLLPKPVHQTDDKHMITMLTPGAGQNAPNTPVPAGVAETRAPGPGADSFANLVHLLSGDNGAGGIANGHVLPVPLGDTEALPLAPQTSNSGAAAIPLPATPPQTSVVDLPLAQRPSPMLADAETPITGLPSTEHPTAELSIPMPANAEAVVPPAEAEPVLPEALGQWLQEQGLDLSLEEAAEWLQGLDQLAQAGQDPKQWLQRIGEQLGQGDEMPTLTTAIDSETAVPAAQWMNSLLAERPRLQKALGQLGERLQEGANSLERLAEDIDGALQALRAWQPSQAAPVVGAQSAAEPVQSVSLSPAEPPVTPSPSRPAAVPPAAMPASAGLNNTAAAMPHAPVASPARVEVGAEPQGAQPIQVETTITTSITQTISAAPGALGLPDFLNAQMLKLQQGQWQERAMLEQSLQTQRAEAQMIANVTQGQAGAQQGQTGQPFNGEAMLAAQIANASGDSSASASTEGGFDSLLEAHKSVAGTRPSPTAGLPGAGKGPRISLGQTFGQPGWQDAMGAKVRWMNNAGLQRAVVHLDPAELGHIEVSIEVAEEQTKIAFHAENPQARETLEQSSARLKEVLAAAGFEGVGVDVGGREGKPAGDSDAGLAKRAGHSSDEDVLSVQDADAERLDALPENSTISAWA